MKPILCLDFDGVLHSYTSGWKGASNIPDPPVPGALEFLVGSLKDFRVCILSSRSHQWGGRRAMKRWLRQHLLALAPSWEETPTWWQDRIAQTSFADPWGDEVWYATKLVIGEIGFPLFKPAATVTIDDRALTFDGTWPALETLRTFKPWNKRPNPLPARNSF